MLEESKVLDISLHRPTSTSTIPTNRKFVKGGKVVKLSTLFAAILLAIFCFATPARAANPDHIAQLLNQRICVNCDLQNADLRGADLRGVSLAGANLRNANLEGAILMATNLKDADLQGANLKGASLLVVDLRGANLKGAELIHSSIREAKFCHTIDTAGAIVNRDC